MVLKLDMLTYQKIFVKKGQSLLLGDAIGKIGNTGRSTGKHLHYEIKINKKSMNPRPFLKKEKMFLKNTNMFINKSKGSSLSIITQGIDFTGEVNTEGDIHLDGNMKGTIKANEVVIGPNGSFEGEIISNILNS